MVLVAHLLAAAGYACAALLAALPVVRPVAAPVRAVAGVLALAVVVHVVALAAMTAVGGQLTVSGLGPALSLAGCLVAATLLGVELVARDVSLSAVAAPLAAVSTLVAAAVGLRPLVSQPVGLDGTWLAAHIVLSFVGIAALATSASAGTMYLLQRRELKSRRFGAVFSFFPPLATLDRVNHVAAIGGWLALTVGVALAFGYQMAHASADLPKLIWATGAWVGATALAGGRVVGGVQARRAAVLSSVTFALVIAGYVALRIAEVGRGQFL